MDRHAFPIKCTEVIYGDNADSIVEIRAVYDASKATKPKVHWPLKSFYILEVFISAASPFLVV
jgi:hypothetical protein